jgi:hypothetical protein
VYARPSRDERGDDEARHLLHDLANDLAAIQVRADILIGMTTTCATSTPALLQADLVTIRATASHAITTAEQIALIITDDERPGSDGRER